MSCYGAGLFAFMHIGAHQQSQTQHMYSK